MKWYKSGNKGSLAGALHPEYLEDKENVMMQEACESDNERDSQGFYKPLDVPHATSSASARMLR